MVAETIGIISGNGKLPMLMASEVRKSGRRVAICAIKGESDPAIASYADAIHWIRIGELGKLTRFFRREGVAKAVMGGKITKHNLLKGDVRPDLEMVQVLLSRRNHGDDSLLGGIAGHLNAKGIDILPSTAFLGNEVVPGQGVLTEREPSRKEWGDIEYGWDLAKTIGRADIGQTVVVKNKAVLAVEAIEGTDAAIVRGGELGFGGVTVVKVAKPNQDMRFDVPTIGLNTMEALIRAKARALAFEALKTILLDAHEFVEQADRHGMAIVGRESK